MKTFRSLAILMCCCSMAAYVSSEEVYVEVQSAQLKKQPKAWAEPTGLVVYGDSLEVLEKTPPWFYIRSPAKKVGFLHTTALNARPVLLRSSSKFLDHTNIPGAVLAGKGFSESTAKAWSKDNPAINFLLVDEMIHSSTIEYHELNTFASQGNLQVGDD